MHQLHSLLSQTYRVGTSAQDPAVDECIRLSLLADDILSETTNGTTTNGESLPHTAAGTVSAVPVARAGDEAGPGLLLPLYSSSAASSRRVAGARIGRASGIQVPANDPGARGSPGEEGAGWHVRLSPRLSMPGGPPRSQFLPEKTSYQLGLLSPVWRAHAP